jgi:hypothetical protein
MTGYTVHTGSTEKFSNGWDRIFKDAARQTVKSKKKAGTKSPKAAKKKSGRKKR